MTLEKDGQVIELTDQAHIDCYLAKGWAVVEPKKKTTKTKKQ